MSEIRTLYHLSPCRIRGHIDPALSSGRLRVVWLCERRMIPWAFCHVARHQGTFRLWIHKVEISSRLLTRRREGVWTTPKAVRVQEVKRARVA